MHMETCYVTQSIFIYLVFTFCHRHQVISYCGLLLYLLVLIVRNLDPDVSLKFKNENLRCSVIENGLCVDEQLE